MAELLHVSVRNTREVRANVTNAPEWRTPGGRNPIKPRLIRVRYSIDTGEVGGVEVLGERADDKPAPYRSWRRNLTRRLHGEDALASAPEWVREFVEAHRPNAGEFLNGPLVDDGLVSIPHKVLEAAARQIHTGYDRAAPVEQSEAREAARDALLAAAAVFQHPREGGAAWTS